MRYIFAGLITLLFFVSTHAQAADHVKLMDVWSAPSIPGSKIGVAYFTVTNHETTDVSIVSAESPVAEIVELHTHQMADDIMQMRKIDAIEVPAGHTVKAEPHGLHLMLINLKQTLAAGESFPITLTLNSGKTLTADAIIEQRNGDTPHTHEGHDGHAHHSH